MHGSHVVLVIVITVALAIVIGAISVAVGLWLRRKAFAGPLRDEWQIARRRLTRKQRSQVWWATMRRRPTDQGELARAQIAFTSYAADVSKRSPLLRNRWFRIGLPLLFALQAANWIFMGFSHHHFSPFYWFMAADSVMLVALWAVFVPRSIARQGDRLKTLRRQIETRHAGLSSGS